MVTYGITGGIGMGKSTAADLLRQRGLPVVDTDLIARHVVEPGMPALDEIRAWLGDAILDQAGALRRDELARRVFSDEAARKKLESIMYPRIRAVWLGQLDGWRTKGAPIAVVVIPLLFETNAVKHLEHTVCVACTAATQRERLRLRGWDDQQIEQRLSAQWPAQKKIDLADYVIWTEGGLDIHAEQLRRVIP